jgi:hypothetical protein
MELSAVQLLPWKILSGRHYPQGWLNPLTLSPPLSPPPARPGSCLFVWKLQKLISCRCEGVILHSTHRVRPNYGVRHFLTSLSTIIHLWVCKLVNDRFITLHTMASKSMSNKRLCNRRPHWRDFNTSIYQISGPSQLGENVFVYSDSQ